jgi:transcriptional regulator GlxA family with amidase domain
VRLWQILSVGSQSTEQRIAKAVEWLKANYAQPLRIDQLAAHVQLWDSPTRPSPPKHVE